jgi:serpin B
MRIQHALARHLLLPALIILSGCSPMASDPVNLTPPANNQQGPSSPAQSQVLRSDHTPQLSPDVPPEDLQALAAGNAAFAFDLYRLLASNPGNLFFSPHSISAALGMTSAGAAGETASQMADTLHFLLPPDRLHPAFNALTQALETPATTEDGGTPFELSIANSLWGQAGFDFLPPFLDVLAVNYDAGMNLVDFAADSEQARQAINAWVEEETRGKVRELVGQGVINNLTRLVLANAIYFKAGWVHPFEASATTPGPFTLLDGSTVDVAMMHQSESFAVADMGEYLAVELPYLGGGASMIVLLPDEGQFEAVESRLSAEDIEAVLAALRPAQVALSLPKFATETAFNLNEPLKALGMVDAFDIERADFSGMTGKPELYIGNVLHKAFVEVNEQGTEAAAATAVIMQLRSAPQEAIEFGVDRPFIYLIRDGSTGSLLFIGRVVDPSA